MGKGFRGGTFRVALQRTLPVLAGYLALGTAFGLLLNGIGLGVFWAAAMSILVYAGSAQFLAVSLIAGGTSLPQVALLTFLLNFRHFFYGLSMVDRYQGMGRRKGYLIFALTDETYALLAAGLPPARGDPADYYCLPAGPLLLGGGQRFGGHRGHTHHL